MMRGPGKWVQNWLGIHSQRTFPKLARQPFSTWHRSQHQSQNGSKPGKRVVFFHDTFMEHNEPQIGRAAIKVLEAAGIRAILLDHKKDSGRPAVSKGLLETAAALARHNLDLLAPYARQGIPIVGCEPSVMAMLVDEYRDLVPGETAQIVADQTTMLEAYLVAEVKSGALSFDFDQKKRHILYHGHCQQKAVFGTDATLALLRLIPNLTVEEIDSGCCGMAGSFGYEREHYHLSIQLAEMTLAPAIREADPTTIICASGTSCREQIQHTTGRQALHPVEVLAGALA
jgi:Fe-S oxidoreductase